VGLNLRIKDSRGSRSQMPVSKPPEARGKPKSICRSTHLDERVQGIPGLRSQVILEPYKGGTAEKKIIGCTEK